MLGFQQEMNTRRDIAILCVMVALASLVTGAVLYQAFNYTDTPSVEAIQEVPVTKGVAPAEYGRQLSGTVNLITHSGANAWHGSASQNFLTDCLNPPCHFFATNPMQTFN